MSRRENHIVPAGVPAYLTHVTGFRRSVMATTMFPISMSRPLTLAAVVIVLLLGATLGLWAYYGTAIFFEMLRAGWAACF